MKTITHEARPNRAVDLRRMRRPPTHPGEMLLEEFLKPLGLSQVEAATRMGMTTNRLNEIVRGKRGVTADTAWRLSSLLGTSAEVWMNLQVQWDLWQAAHTREIMMSAARESIASTVDQHIRSAIRRRRVIQFGYQGTVRIGEPYDYGVFRGHVSLLVYQLRGRSKRPLPGWRMIDVAGIENLVLLNETFGGSRGRAGQAHKRWDELFLRVA